MAIETKMLSFLKFEIILKGTFFLVTGYSWLLVTTFMFCRSKIYKTDSNCCFLGRIVSYTSDYGKNYFWRCSVEGNPTKNKKQNRKGSHRLQ